MLGPALGASLGPSLAVALALAAAAPVSSAKPAKPPPPVKLVLKKVIQVGRWPKGVELTPDGKWALTSNFWANTISVIDTEKLQVVRTIRTGESSPVEIDYTHDGKTAVVTGGWQKDELLLVDLEAWTIKERLPGKQDGPDAERRLFPKVVAFSPDGARYFVSYWKSDNVAVFDAVTNALVGLVPTGHNPRGIAVTPDGKKAYVANFDTKGNSVTVFQADAAPFPVLKTIAPLPNPRHAVASPDGRFVYVSLFGQRGGVAKLDTATDEVVARSTGTGKRGKTIKLSPDGRWLFLANFGANTVSVLDTATLEEVAREKTGREPCGVEVSADGKRLWTTDWDDDRVRVWDIVVAEPPPADPAPGATAPGPPVP